MKNILIGITGSIAAYKVPEFIKQLADNEYNVKVVLTESATHFVNPLTLSTVSRNQVFTNDVNYDNPMLHIELARFADLIVIIPTTANFIAKMAHGLCDDLLSTVCIASTAKIIIVPAMNHIMWANSIMQSNIDKLALHGITVFNPVYGEQICGEIGIGSMLNIQEVFNRIIKL